MFHETLNELMRSRGGKNLLNSNGIRESEENEIPNLPNVDTARIKPVELDKDKCEVQPSNLSSQEAPKRIIIVILHQSEINHLFLSQFMP